MKDERYFEIRDVGKDGCGSFETFCVSSDATEREIGDIASELLTESKSRRDEMNKHSFFYQSHWRPTVHVVEETRKIVPPDQFAIKRGREFMNEWKTKRGGLKLKICNSYIRITMTNGNKYEGNGYEYRA